ncbi:MAG: hypothetical protein OES24_16435 [Acidimicrobiia bacterium]|nr:hypothetical protein [Acidimicrobiia bacterium]
MTSPVVVDWPAVVDWTLVVDWSLFVDWSLLAVVDVNDTVDDAVEELVLSSLIDVAALVEVADSSVSSPQPASRTATSDTATINRVIFMSCLFLWEPARRLAGIDRRLPWLA